MLFVKRISIFTLSMVVVVALAVAAGFVWSGMYDMGADAAHTRPVYSLLETLRVRSITARARRIHPPPNLRDPAMIRRGAGNYAAMCAGCHLAPGMPPTEISKGLYPAPPVLARLTHADPSHHFWIIKHGIKASGMPAWGLSMDDQSIWGLVAFLQQMPRLDAAQYHAMVEGSEGHSHGGGESHSMGEAHEHQHGEEHDHDHEHDHEPAG